MEEQEPKYKPQDLPPLPPVIPAVSAEGEKTSQKQDQTIAPTTEKPILAVIPATGMHNQPDNEPQFDDRGLEYEPSGKLLIAWLIALILAIGTITGFLLLTPQGKELLGLTESTSSTSSQTSTTSSSSSSAQAITEQNFSGSNAEDTTSEIVDEIDNGLSDLNPNTDFEEFDATLEFGAE